MLSQFRNQTGGTPARQLNQYRQQEAPQFGEESNTRQSPACHPEHQRATRTRSSSRLSPAPPSTQPTLRSLRSPRTTTTRSLISTPPWRKGRNQGQRGLLVTAV